MVGITNPDVNARLKEEASDSHRHTSDSNPFDYLTRARMISRSVERDLGLDHQVDIVVFPFDVSDNKQWGLIPKNAVQYVSVIEPWDYVKAARFREQGFKVVEISVSRVISGTQVRRLWRDGGDISSLVPQGTQSVLSQF